MIGRAATAFVVVAAMVTSCGDDRRSPVAPVQSAPPAGPEPPWLAAVTPSPRRIAPCAPHDAGARDASSSEAAPDGGAVGDADRVIATLRDSFRRCYQEGLASDRNMQGRVVLTARVVADGTVEAVCSASENGLSGAVVDCIGDVLQHAQFRAPTSGRATINVPITFVQAKKP